MSKDSIHWPAEYDPSRCPVHIVNSLDIAASPAIVWEQLITAADWHTWYSEVSNVRIKDGSRKLSQGMNFTWNASGMTITNADIYVPMQGHSELGLSGKLADWDRTADLREIEVPTLFIGAQHDTMNPMYMQMMSQRVQKGHYLYCPDGSHLLYDDQKVYFEGLLQFVRNVEAGLLK